MSDTQQSDSKRHLGDFEIFRELGRGGMGIVYEARQISLNRKVALKVLSARLGLESKTVVRFRREAEAAARLHHTNIVPIYATGEEEGVDRVRPVHAIHTGCLFRVSERGRHTFGYRVRLRDDGVR